MTAVARMTWRALLDGSRSQVTAVARMTWRALAPSVVSLTLILPPHPIKTFYSTELLQNKKKSEGGGSLILLLVHRITLLALWIGVFPFGLESLGNYWNTMVATH